MQNIDPAQVRDYFTYNPDTGELRWKKVDSNRAKVGEIAGHSVSDEDGRVTVGFKCKLIRAHIIIWAYQTGQWPTKRIDHKNRNPSDNRWENLREASHAENMRNITRPSRANTSGIRGVTFEKGAWVAKIRFEGKHYYLGRFKTKELASEAYMAASKKFHEQFSPYQPNFPS